MKKPVDLLKMELDSIPKYLLLRDVIKVDNDDIELKAIKESVMKNKWVDTIIKQQLVDGSWGTFHSMSQNGKSTMTTEQALRRLIILGLDHTDEPMKRIVEYMEKHLLGEIELKDRVEKKHNWTLFTHLIAATWVRIIDPNNLLALEIANDWANIIISAFSSDIYNPSAYKEAYYDIHKVSEGKHMLGFTNFYVVAILSDLLPKQVEMKFIDYIMNNKSGIYYIYDGSLNILPDKFDSLQASRYINAYSLLCRYAFSRDKLKTFKRWLLSNIQEDGFWDMGQASKDNIQFPLSNSWRKLINRKIDCTIRIMRLLCIL
ncbi:hypothetical protein SH1V18_12820 [Vallitalea longa]|uniref:Uncharacterized protein n=1 Tax=Vallitalea longa TaxID=2936439 RepID=A0A9W6DET8_9FIRM|nr:hypothetical protein [Vallitalea longa]GKX28802.1 hypothetical protein SH1V18_12820 [Vallitalea longa]